MRLWVQSPVLGEKKITKPETVPLEEYNIKDSHRERARKYDVLLKNQTQGKIVQTNPEEAWGAEADQGH